MVNPKDARNDNTGESAQLANPGPIPPEPEDATDTGTEPGDDGPHGNALAPEDGSPADEPDED